MTPDDPKGAPGAPTLELVYDGNPVLVEAHDVIVGRTAKCTVRVVHPLVSREHCRIEPRPDGLFVVDLGSVNGTWVNGVRVTDRLQVRAGDKLGLGRDGAVLVVERAIVGGVDVSRRAREEDMKTMVAGDVRAAGVVARVEVAAEALPALGVADEPPTRGVGDRTRPVSVDPPPQPSGSAIPVVTALSSVVMPRDSGDVTREADTQETAPSPRGGFLAGFATGVAIGLLVVVALAKFTQVLEPLRDAVRGTVRGEGGR
jgi:pSer/pThr/pTyr-binding forkhead associated (FHA) protein